VYVRANREDEERVSSGALTQNAKKAGGTQFRQTKDHCGQGGGCTRCHAWPQSYVGRGESKEHM